jgi:hypothetical protein
LNVEGGKLVVSSKKKEGQFFKVFWKDQLNLYLKETIEILIRKPKDVILFS